MSATPNDCFHLTVEMVREIHAGAIANFGGSDGIRDLALLESAVAAPQRRVSGGQSPYADVIEVGAAYLFYLCKNHPFIDGNKRAALGSCIVFLRLNDLKPQADGPESGKTHDGRCLRKAGSRSSHPKTPEIDQSGEEINESLRAVAAFVRTRPLFV